MIATSSAVVARSAAPVVQRRCPCRDWICPNAPKRTFAIERFIARPISSVSSVPDAPTSAPLTIRTFSCSDEAGRGGREPREGVQQRDHDRHVGAADRQHEEDAEASEATITPTSSHWDSFPARITSREPERGRDHERVHELLPRIDDRPAADQLLQLREGDQRAGEGDRADDRREDDRRPRCRASSRPGSGARLWNSASAISATAPPPTPLNSATICGIAVIFTRRAPTRTDDGADRHRDRDPARSSRARPGRA